MEAAFWEFPEERVAFFPLSLSLPSRLSSDSVWITRCSWSQEFWKPERAG